MTTKMIIGLVVALIGAPDEQKPAPESPPSAEQSPAEEPKAEEPKAEEPKAEEPKAEEPKAEEPKAEEPKAEEPKAEESKAEESKAEESKAEESKAKAKVEVKKKRIGPKKGGAPWELKEDEGESFRVWVRDVVGTNIREVKLEAVIRAPIKRVWEVISTVEDYPDFMPYMVDIQVVGKPGPGTMLVYHHIDPPLVSARDYTLVITDETDPKKGHYHRYWTPMNDKGPGPKKGIIRLDICDGSWVLDAYGEDKTKAVYWLYTDPGGSIPAWIANKANTVSLPDLIEAIEKRSDDPKWTP